jgi:hypothetical protein
MNTRCAREYTMFAHARILRNWHEQRPSIYGDLDTNVMGDVAGVCCVGVDLLLISFMYRGT